MVPASWLVVDELMIPFQGRTKHNIKIRGKPIKEGFKMWCLSFKGYIWTFSFHSSFEEDEGMTPSRTATQPIPLVPIHFASTQQVPLYLCEQVRRLFSTELFIVFLDNLFLNVNVAHALLAINFAIMGTTRKNVTSLPLSFTNILAKNKEAKKDEESNEKKKKKQPLAYNSILAVIINYCLCFLWQDNNAVLAITTAYSLYHSIDRVQRKRKRPSSTSTNAKQAHVCFKGQSQK